MSLFNDIQDVKKHVGGGVNVSVELESLNPAIDMAVQKHLIHWISKEQWEDLVEAFANTPTTEQGNLIPYVRRPLAMLGMFEYSHIGGIQVSESGFHRAENEHHKTAYKYQENQYKDWMLENGYEAIEMMLDFLETNEDDYPLWKASQSYMDNKVNFINTAKDFRKGYSKYISRYTFEILRALMEDIETFAILPIIGQSLFDVLKEGIQDKNLSDPQKKLLPIIQKAIANFTIEEGLKRQWVRIQGKNVVQTEKLDSQSYEKEASASRIAASVAIQHNEEFGNRHISNLVKYLKKNIADFPEYQTFLDEISDNIQSEAPEDHCFDRDECKPNNNNSEGIVNL